MMNLTHRVQLSSAVTAFLAMGGILNQVIFYQLGSHVQIAFLFPFNGQWQIHELPVDLTIDPKLRCKAKYVGKSLPYNSRFGNNIGNINVESLIMNSIVLSFNGELVACGTFVPESLSYTLATIDLKLGLIGKVYIAQWPCKFTYTLVIPLLLRKHMPLYPTVLFIQCSWTTCSHAKLKYHFNKLIFNAENQPYWSSHCL